ncbi:hypothetical protein J3Q64DRAFT_1726193 [Phycomyces blakesleeanus]|uniref:Uncharacterized protein n=2 Tax=Phycomyces blakesleeanus TaxID=4837 RepID=A0A162YIA2_PHYB8|nr:hypothetical protein PHYBLDRAFT_76865 [Phycomyces blakesleeanus NRRL 1555(-)]OAD80885.1 hypothetical protein PHYBLDRAFT_76865 [Phycomyces blakesleeanus NRRL 1555(-)]|eukprot:XP_018298925.1 hypothetical protein PHYBLDRAFT_76865 [Phycomyces blakesleeanus NRRL 1555(-)]
MSSVSSHEGSDKDGFFHRSFPEGLASRYAYLRKTDLLDTFESNTRPRDTDAWSVAATVDDQESVMSGHGGNMSIAGSISRVTTEGKETDDDRSTLDGSARNGVSSSNEPALSIDNPGIRLETFRDLDMPSAFHDNASVITGDDEEKYPRSVAAEFGDDGTRSAAGDFSHIDSSDDEERTADSGYQGNSQAPVALNDAISAPPQPQPSFASATKPYTTLIEENEMLREQLQNLERSQKQQIEVIANLRTLTACGEEVYGRALHMSHATPEEQDRLGRETTGLYLPSTSSFPDAADYSCQQNNGYLDMERNAPLSHIVNARTLTQRLAQLAEWLTRFVQDAVDQDKRITLEQSLFTQIVESYLSSLPFGTEKQELLNTAYSDQIRRFQSTLGSNFSKWYRRQTVQSLSLNPATKEYLGEMRTQMTKHLEDLLASMRKTTDDQGDVIPDRQLWDDILDLCMVLSLEIHGGDADVYAKPIAAGSKYDEEIMAVVGDSTADKNKIVKLVVSPLFIDEDEVVLLPARVLLE